MVDKSGYLKTLEALIAIILTFLFLIFIIPNSLEGSKQENQKTMQNLLTYEGFRNELINLTGCVNTTSNNTLSGMISQNLGANYEYHLCKDQKPQNLPRKEVFAESLFFTGNITDYYDSKIIRLYYWNK